MNKYIKIKNIILRKNIQITKSKKNIIKISNYI